MDSDRDRWNREPYTHTISVVDLRHWLPHLNMGNTLLLPMKSGPVTCTSGASVAATMVPSVPNSGVRCRSAATVASC